MKTIFVKSMQFFDAELFKQDEDFQWIYMCKRYWLMLSLLNVVWVIFSFTAQHSTCDIPFRFRIMLSCYGWCCSSYQFTTWFRTYSTNFFCLVRKFSFYYNCNSCVALLTHSKWQQKKKKYSVELWMVWCPINGVGANSTHKYIGIAVSIKRELKWRQR